MSDRHSKFAGDDDVVSSDLNDAAKRAGASGGEVEARVEESHSLIDEAKELARRDWDNQYDDISIGSDGVLGTEELDPTDLEAEIGGSIGDPTSDFDSKISNMQAGLGGVIGVPDDGLGGTFGDDQIQAGGEFNDMRGGGGSANPASANISDAGLITNDLQGAVDLNPAGDETRLESDFANVETTLGGGFTDEEAQPGSKFDQVRSEVERNFSDVSGTVDSSNPEWHSTNDNDLTDTTMESGDLRFADTGAVGEVTTGADSLNAHARDLGERAHGAGADLKQRAAEAREQASSRLEDARRELGQLDGKSMIEDVQDKAKGLFSKVKDVFDGDKKS